MAHVETPFQPSLGDVDAAGVVFHARLFDAAQRGLERFLEERGFPIARLCTEGPRTPVVRAEAEFRVAIRLGDRLLIASSAAETGTASFRMKHLFLRPDGSEAARVEVVHVAIDAHGRSIPLPADFRAAIG